MAQKHRLVEVWAGFEQTIVDKASGASDSGPLAKLKINALNIYDILHCVNRQNVLNNFSY